MGTLDIGVYESGSGGEITILNNDVLLSEVLFQQIYLACFGGNVEAVTTGQQATNVTNEDWWGNTLLFNGDPAKQFNSFTEKALRENVLNSTGRNNITNAVNTDLQYLSAVAEITVNVVILSVNNVQINVSMVEPNSQQNKILQFLWDNAKNELIINQVI